VPTASLVGRRGVRPAAPHRARRAARSCAVGLVAAALMPSRCGREGGRADRAQPHRPRQVGQQDHLLCDANGLVLRALISPTNTHDSKLFEPLLDTNPGVSRRRRRRERPQRRPATVWTRATTARAGAPTCTGAGSECASPAVGSRTRPRLGRVRWGHRKRHLLAAVVQAARSALRLHRTRPPAAAHPRHGPDQPPTPRRTRVDEV
jgi:hypothetical protein